MTTRDYRQPGEDDGHPKKNAPDQKKTEGADTRFDSTAKVEARYWPAEWRGEDRQEVAK